MKTLTFLFALLWTTTVVSAQTAPAALPAPPARGPALELALEAARAGGVLLTVAGTPIGAIGVGGARGSENDEACALAGVAKVAARLQ